MSELEAKEASKSLPSRWKIEQLGDILAPLSDGRTIHQGWSPQAERVPSEADDVWGVLKTTAVQPGQFDPAHNKRLPDSLEPRPKLEVEVGDLLMTSAGPRARCGVTCLVRQSRPRLMISGKMYRFRVNESVADPKYVEAFLQSPEAERDIDAIKTGISDSGLNLTQARFRKLTIPIAPLDEQRLIVEAIESHLSHLDAGVESLQRAKRNVERMRASILQAAVNGRLVHHDTSGESAAALLSKVLSARRIAWDRDGTPSRKVPWGKPHSDV